MAIEEISRVRELLASYPGLRDKSIEELRGFVEDAARLFPLPEGISIDAVDAGGVPAERVRARGVRDDAVFLYLHGGGYVLGSPLASRPLAVAFSEAASAPVLVPGYRLAPEHRFPAALEDAVRSYRWLLSSGTRPERVALIGESAGGGLVVSTLVALRDAGDPLPRAGICISPWVDLTCSSESFVTRASVDPILVRKDALWLASLYLGDQDPRNPLASPLFADMEGLPPLLIQVGSEEVLLDEAIQLERKARQAGVDCTLEVWDGMIHVWHVFFHMLREGREAISRIGAYFRGRIP